jgi:hypothetical protein
LDEGNTSMHEMMRPSEVRAGLSVEDWNSGYLRGYHDGHSAGELLGEQALRDRLLRRLVVVEQDLRLKLLHNMETPLAVLRAVERLIEDRS